MSADPSLLTRCLDHLRALVSYDTQNPPRAIGTGGIFDYLQAQLPGFTHRVTDFGAGAVSLYSVRGKPRFLINVHLDTVPVTPTWTRNPFELLVTEDRAIGMGACDIKGAAAAMVAAAQVADGDCAFLFSSDEEANDARCIAGFLAEKHAFDAVLVAEPTKAEAVLAHRGISSVRLRFAGRAGHASAASAASDSAVHQALRWGERALAHAESLAHHRFGGLTGLRFNIGRIEGGIKANVIAPSCEVRLGFRPLPTMSTEALLEAFRTAGPALPAEFEPTFYGASLPAGDTAAAETRRLAARDVADELGLPIGNAVDFWTEAALFSAAGHTSLVYGPGDIAQAHSADEWVALDQLQQVTESYVRIITHGRH
ncbi:MAG TPA: acetylornithine deacetylase [Tahibacter sp.]|nr:acetylornithine deacetylase [Tahibacter sp.]